MRARFMTATGVALVLASNAAYAQSTSSDQLIPPPTATVDQGTAAAPPQDQQGEQIIVTGSRLPQTADTTPAPVLTVDKLEIEESGTDNLADILTDFGPISVGLSDNNSQNYYAQAGLNLVDLRRLGPERTLVLVNGRRTVPGDIGSFAVDLNSIPAPLVQRVEIVTGGSSAVYGADAVAGVINIILRSDFEGLEARVRGGITSRGDGESYGISLTAGTNFADNRGNINLFALYDKIRGVPATARKYASDDLYDSLNPAVFIDGQEPSPENPIVITRPNVCYVGPTEAGTAFLGPLGMFTVAPGGTGIVPWDFGELGTDIFGVQIGGSGQCFQKFDNLSLPVERINFAGNVTYDFTDNIRGFFEARVIDTKTRTRWQPVAEFEYGNVDLNLENPFVPADLRALVEPFGTFFPGVLAKIWSEWPSRRGANNDRLSMQFTGGVRGDLGSRFHYEAFAGYGRTNNHSRLVGGRDQDRFLESLDVVLIDGVPQCRSAEARARGCQPLNFFNPLSTPGGIAYSYVEDNYDAHQSLKMAGASINGDLFDLPAGPIGMVLGVEARKNSLETEPSHAVQQCRIQLLCETAPTKGSVSVKEAFGELRIPILKDNFVDDLSVQGAARVSDYDTTGTVWTWNIGGVFAPVQDIRFRAMRSRAVRSPTPEALFTAQSQTFSPVDDPCSEENIAAGPPARLQNCQTLGRPAGFVQTLGTKSVLFGGNPNLDVETGNTWTVGTTLEPRFLPGFRATIDWYDIKLKNAIQTRTVGEILTSCLDVTVDPNGNPNCAAIERGPDFNIVNILSSWLNVALVKTSGVDFNIDYTFNLASVINQPGRVHLNVAGTWVDKLRYFENADDPSTEIILEGHGSNQPPALAGVPKWEALGTASYFRGPLEVTWRTRWIDSVFIVPFSRVTDTTPQNVIWDKPRSGDEFFHDLSIAYDFTDRANLRVNVNNIFDNKPPRRVLMSQGRNWGTAYPNLGTNFTAVLTYRFQ